MRKDIDPGRGELVAEVDAEHDLWALDRPLEPGKLPSRDAYAAWQAGRVLIRRLSEEERERRFRRSAELLGFAVESREDFPRATLDVPFSHGFIALTSPREEAFPDEEVAIVRQFAPSEPSSRWAMSWTGSSPACRRVGTGARPWARRGSSSP